MPTAPLPDRPDPDQLRNQARELQRGVRAGDPAARAHALEHLDAGDVDAADAFPLHLAQLAVARHYGCASWARLLERIELIRRFGRTPDIEGEPGADNDDTAVADRFLRLACLTYGSDDGPHRWRQARQILDDDPAIAAASVHTAAAAGDVNAVERFLAADRSGATRLGGPFDWSPLLYAVGSRVNDGASAAAIVRLLLDAGADPNEGYLWHGMYPFTALTLAFGHGELGRAAQPPHPAAETIARLLLDADADPNDSQALYNRMFEPGNEHLELLFRYGLGKGDGGPWRKRLPEVVGEPAALLRDQLEWAITHGFRERVALLLDHGIDPNGPGGRHGLAPLVLAVENGEREIADLLRARGARAEGVDEIDQFVGAVMAADRAAIAPEVAARARAARPGLVVWAASRGRADAVRVLVELGWDVNAYGRGDAPIEEEWETALHVAAGHGDLALVDLLIDLGADPNLRDARFDAPPLGWARHGEHADVADRLEPLTIV